LKRALLCAAVAALLIVPAANAAYRPGQAARAVCGVKWMISGPHGHKPNVFTKVHGTYGRPLRPFCNYYGPTLARAVRAYKFRLGYPMRYVRPVIGPYFLDLLQGRRQRPLRWVALAQRRATPVVSGPTLRALRIKALELSQLGVHEVPDGSNRGPRISYGSGGFGPYQGATGAYGAAWCASFQVWAVHAAGYGWVGDRSAGVLYIEGWAHARGYIQATAKVGDLVAYLDDGGHIGYVVKVTASGYVEVSGNTGNAVRETWHPWNFRLRVFIALPGIG
jgi:hypothetical protein